MTKPAWMTSPSMNGSSSAEAPAPCIKIDIPNKVIQNYSSPKTDAPGRESTRRERTPTSTTRTIRSTSPRAARSSACVSRTSRSTCTGGTSTSFSTIPSCMNSPEVQVRPIPTSSTVSRSCQTDSSPPSARGATMPNRCPQGHRLEEFITGHDWRCSQCRGEWLGGAKFGGCIRCKWDMCPACMAAPSDVAGARTLGTTPKFGRPAPATPTRRPRPKPSVAPPTTPPTRYQEPDDTAYGEQDDATTEAPEQHSAPGSSSAGAAHPPWRRVEPPPSQPASSSSAPPAPWRQEAPRPASPEEAPEEDAEDDAGPQQPPRKKRRGKPRCRPGSTERRLRKLEMALEQKPYLDTGDA